MTSRACQRQRLSRRTLWLLAALLVSLTWVTYQFFVSYGSDVNASSVREGHVPAEVEEAVEEFRAEHPDIPVVVSASVVTYGFSQTPVVGYVQVTDDPPSIYLSGGAAGDPDWDAVLQHEYAHILQFELIAEQASGGYGSGNPFQDWRFWNATQEMNDLFEVYIPGEPMHSTAHTMTGLEFAADCYAEPVGGVAEGAYLGSYCPATGSAAMSLVAAGVWPAEDAVAAALPPQRSRQV